jgi:hypothetical protein
MDRGQIMAVGSAFWDETENWEDSVRANNLMEYPGWKEHLWDDTKLVRSTYELLLEADLVVTWFGKRFDVPALQTRMALAGLPPLENFGGRHLDLYWTARREFTLVSNSLDNAMKFFGCPYHKTDYDPATWNRASHGSQEDMEYVVEHCRRDVLGLGWVYSKLRPYIRQHPVVADRGACRVCGSKDLQFRGYALLANPRAEPKRRVQCQHCGAWDQRTEG